MSSPAGKPAEGTKRDVKIAIPISFLVTAIISFLFKMNDTVGTGLSAGAILLVGTVVFLVVLVVMRIIARLRGSR